MLAAHGWTLCHFMVAFHQQSNTLDVQLRPMTRSELCVEFEGASWLENRLRVVRETKVHSGGPSMVRVNGGDRLDTRSEISTPVDGLGKVSPGDHDATVQRRKLFHAQHDDSGVSIDRRESPSEVDGSRGFGSTPSSSSRSVMRRTDPGRLASVVTRVLTTPVRSQAGSRDGFAKRARTVPKLEGPGAGPALSNRSVNYSGIGAVLRDIATARPVQSDTRSLSSSAPSIGGECLLDLLY